MGDDALDTLDLQMQAFEVDSGAAVNGTPGELLASACLAASAELGTPTPAPAEDPQAEEAAGAHSASLGLGLPGAAPPPTAQLTKYEFYSAPHPHAFTTFLLPPRRVF